MLIILVIILLLLAFGGIGYHTGGLQLGSTLFGTILIIVLIVWLLGAL